MLAMLLPQTCTINRSQPTGTNGRTQMQELYTNVPCLLQPMNTTTAIENGFDLGRAYNITYAAGQDVQAADQVIIGANTYTVKLTQPNEVPIVGYVLAMTQQEVK